jgi:hypothetical protein
MEQPQTAPNTGSDTVSNTDPESGLRLAPSPEREQLHAQVRRVSVRLKSAGMLNITDAFLSAFAPLAPLGAQALWMLQPTLSIFGDGTMDELARVLDEPNGIEWLRTALWE